MVHNAPAHIYNLETLRMGRHCGEQLENHLQNLSERLKQERTEQSLWKVYIPRPTGGKDR